MRVAVFTDTFLPQINGVTKTLTKMAAYFEENNIEYMFFTPEDPQKDKSSYNVESFFSIRLFLYPECRFAFPSKSKVFKVLDEYKPDVIQLMTEFNVGLSGLEYAKKRNIPVISNYSTNFIDILKSFRIGILEKVAWKYLLWFHNEVDITITPSTETEKLINRKGILNTAIVGRGINYSDFSPDKRSNIFGTENRKILLYVGRVSPEKDLDILRESMYILNKKYKENIILIVTGEGPMKKELKETMPENVIFTGFKKGEELSQIYASAHIFVFPSTFETYGNVVLESMASGVPVVGSAKGGVLENIFHGYNGMLSKPRDSESFASNVEKLLIDEKLRKKISENAREFSKTKSWSLVFEKLIDIYRNAIANKKQYRKAI